MCGRTKEPNGETEKNIWKKNLRSRRLTEEAKSVMGKSAEGNTQTQRGS